MAEPAQWQDPGEPGPYGPDLQPLPLNRPAEPASLRPVRWRAAAGCLAKVLLQKPQVLLLDEPTKGLDGSFKEILAGILKQLTGQGVCVILVSHDVEFCAAYGDRCALFFDGSIAAEDAPLPFFSGLSFYTTAASRMARTLLPEAITASEVIVGCGGCPPKAGPFLHRRQKSSPGGSVPPEAPAGMAQGPGRSVRRRGPGSLPVRPDRAGSEGSVRRWKNRRSGRTPPYTASFWAHW